MAASVQHNHRASCRCIERGEHAVEVDVFFASFVVRVSLNREARVGEQAAVVFPTWVRDQNLGLGVQVAKKISTDLQTACSTQTLHCGHSA